MRPSERAPQLGLIEPEERCTCTVESFHGQEEGPQVDVNRDCPLHGDSPTTREELGEWLPITPSNVEILVRNSEGEYRAMRCGDEWLTDVDGETLRIDPEPIEWKQVPVSPAPTWTPPTDEEMQAIYPHVIIHHTNVEHGNYYTCLLCASEWPAIAGSNKRNHPDIQACVISRYLAADLRHRQTRER